MKTLFDPRFPFDPKQCPIFYGWVILVVSTIGIVMSIPGQTMGISVFTDFLIDSLGLTRGQLSMAYMFGTIISGLILPASGRLFDIVGARVMIVGAGILLTFTLMGLSACDWVIAWLDVNGDGWWNTSVRFFLIFKGFFLLRYAGQGLTAMTSRAMLGKWFNRKRGLVSGISSVAASFCFASAPLFLNEFVSIFDWNGAWLFLAALSFGMGVLGWLTFRDNPEECGLWMDGDAANPDEVIDPNDQFHIYKEFTLEEARKTFTFWVFNLGLSAFSLATTAVTFHVVSIGEEYGLDRDASLAIFMPMAVVGVVMNLVFLVLSNHIKLKYFLAFNMFWMAVGIAGIFHFDDPFSYGLVSLGFGISSGIFSPLVTVLWPKFYGREHLGAISGFNMSCMVIASALGPFIFGESFEIFGSYDMGIAICLVIPIVLFFLAFFVENPQLQFHKKT